MGKNKKGITLVALAITIVIMIILVGVSIYLTISDNGLIQKATEGNKNQTLTELYEITNSELSYLKIAGKAKGKEEEVIFQPGILNVKLTGGKNIK